MPLHPAALVLVLVAVSGCATASLPAPVVAASEADPAALVAWDGALVLAAGPTVRLIRDGAVVRTVNAGAPVHTLAVVDGALYAGTARGLIRLSAPEAAPEAVDLPGGAERPVRAIAASEDGRLWASVGRSGAFVRIADHRWTPVLEVHSVTGIAPGDSAVWVGSHVGLYRHAGPAPSPDGWVAFYEEGTGGHGLADEIVDRLIAPGDGSVWVVHPRALSVFDSPVAAQPHMYDYVGRPGGQLHDVAALPAGGYLLATDTGVLLLDHLGDGHVHAQAEVYAHDGVSAASLDRVFTPPVDALAGVHPTRLLVDAERGVVWLASARGVWAVSLGAARPALAAR